MGKGKGEEAVALRPSRRKSGFRCDGIGSRALRRCFIGMIRPKDHAQKRQ